MKTNNTFVAVSLLLAFGGAIQMSQGFPRVASANSVADLHTPPIASRPVADKQPVVGKPKSVGANIDKLRQQIEQARVLAAVTDNLRKQFEQAQARAAADAQKADAELARTLSEIARRPQDSFDASQDEKLMEDARKDLNEPDEELRESQELLAQMDKDDAIFEQKYRRLLERHRVMEARQRADLDSEKKLFKPLVKEPPQELASVKGSLRYTQVKVVDKEGKEIHTIPSLSLAPGVVAIPVKSLELFGLVVTYNSREKRVYVYSPPSHPVPGEGSTALGFKSGDHGIYSPISGYSRGLRAHPLALNQNGALYISVKAIGSSFPGGFRYQWNQNSQTVVIKAQDSTVVVW